MPWKFQGEKEKSEGEKEDGQQKKEGEEEKGRENEGNCPLEDMKNLQEQSPGVTSRRFSLYKKGAADAALKMYRSDLKANQRRYRRIYIK
jgi:hypothetical protein